MDTILCRGELRDIMQVERDGTAAVRVLFVVRGCTKIDYFFLPLPGIFERLFNDRTDFNTATHPEGDPH